MVLHLKRRNENANWDSGEKTVTFKVRYRPIKGVSCSNVTYRLNNSSGTGIGKDDWVNNIDSVTGIYVSWVYDHTTSDAGYTQGYRVRIYNSKDEIAKTYYTTAKSIIIPKADIPKMQHTFIDITPYYANDNAVADASKAGNYWYYSGAIDKCKFVVLAWKPEKPVIEFPIEGSDWINEQFRVCFHLPSDKDKGEEYDTYHFQDIEIDVNGKVYRMTSDPVGGTPGATITTAPFSTETLYYGRKMVVCPYLGGGMPSATTYKVRVRVKKVYTVDKTIWSEWSAVRTFNVHPAVFNPARGDTIYATHYNDMKAVLARVCGTYNVAWSNRPVDVARSTKILRTQYPYDNLYSKAVEVKNVVNSYGPFDTGHINVRFDYQDEIKTNFNRYVELVTAASNENMEDGSGRNYMKIMYDRCNRLK